MRHYAGHELIFFFLWMFSFLIRVKTNIFLCLFSQILKRLLCRHSGTAAAAAATQRSEQEAFATWLDRVLHKHSIPPLQILLLCNPIYDDITIQMIHNGTDEYINQYQFKRILHMR